MGLWAGTHPAREADYPCPSHLPLGDTRNTTRSDPQAEGPPTLGTILCDTNTRGMRNNCVPHKTADLCAPGQVLCHGQEQ